MVLCRVLHTVFHSTLFGTSANLVDNDGKKRHSTQEPQLVQQRQQR